MSCWKILPLYSDYDVPIHSNTDPISRQGYFSTSCAWAAFENPMAKSSHLSWINDLFSRGHCQKEMLIHLLGKRYLPQSTSTQFFLFACLPTKESILRDILFPPASTLHSKVNSLDQSCLVKTAWIMKTISSLDLLKGCVLFLTRKLGWAS